ncbi:PREDICTED: protein DETOXIFICATION 21-like [Tarenaya hassleriana]|uniref:protein DETOXIFICATION 21-like n=1 Tax=Tarenaya hassleriana TaxID=28532 RepID=UPI00053C425F|nr:PREDICTED: protein DETOXIFICATION 21-like [Tarenaya hassleriana]
MAKGEGKSVDLKEKLLRHEAGKEENHEGVTFKEKLWEESKKLWKVAGPAIFTRFSTFGVFVISQSFIGHVGPTELAAYSIAFTVLLRFSNGILLGMASALETLCGQAYGAKQYSMLGIYLQRSWIVLTCCSICLMPVYIFSGPIFIALGQEEHIVRVARIIALYILGVNFSFIPSFTCQMYLQAQSKNRMIAYVAAVSVVMHLILSWLLMVHFELGIHGAMISTLVAYWFPNICQLLFIICGGCRETWTGWSLLAFKDLWPVVKLSLSSGGMLCLELWYPTILVLFTGNLKNAEVAVDALSICLNVSGLESMISLGFYAAVSVRVSNELGAGNSKGAKFATIVATGTSLALGFVLFVVFLCLRGTISYVFTQSEAVAKEVADLSPFLAFTILLNSVQPVLSGVSIGAGWQSYVAYVNLACYYVIGIPVGIVLGYTLGWQVKGIWIGMLVGIFFQTLVLVGMTLRTDWDHEVSSTRVRLNRWSVFENRNDREHKNLEDEA